MAPLKPTCMLHANPSRRVRRVAIAATTPSRNVRGYRIGLMWTSANRAEDNSTAEDDCYAEDDSTAEDETSAETTSLRLVALVL